MPWVLLGVALLLLARAAGPRATTPLPLPPGTPQPPPTPRPRPGGPHFEEIAPVPEALELEPGTTYLAQVEVPFLLGAFVGLREITEALEAEGFVVVSATQARPKFWPSADAADWYLTASYSGTPRTRPIPAGIARLWRAVAAPAGA